MIIDHLLPDTLKNEEWCKRIALSISRNIAMGGIHHPDGKRAYDVYYGKQDSREYDYLTGGGERALPAKVRWFHIMRPLIDILMSTAESRPFDPMVHAIDDRSMDQKRETQKKQVLSKVFGFIAQRQEALSQLSFQIGAMRQALAAQAEQGAQEDPMQMMRLQMVENQFNQMERSLGREQGGLDIELEEAERKASLSAQAAYEAEIGNGLEYLFHKQGLKETFLKGMESALVLDQEIYTIDDIMDGHDPRVRWVNPLAVTYGISYEASCLSEVPWIIEDRFIPIHEVIEKYGAFMSDDERLRVSGSDYGLHSYMNAGVVPYINEDFGNYGEFQDCDVPGVVNGGGFTLDMRRVRRVCWQSARKIRARQFTSSEDPTITHTHVITDGDRVRKGEKVLTRYVSDWWEATIIGDSVVVNARPCAFQHRDIRDIGKSYGPYIGHAYNGLDRRPYSRVLAVEDVNVLYNLTMFHVERLMALAKIKGFVMDKAQLPKGMGWEEWYDHLEHGIAVIDSGKGKRGEAQGFNQFQSYDLGFGDTIGQLISIQDRLEAAMGRILGIPPHRLGEVGSQTLPGAMKQSITQSNITTETLFYKHDTIKKRVLDRLVNVLPYAWREGRRGNYVAGDYGQKMFNIGSKDLKDRSFEVFFLGSSREQRLVDMATTMMSQEYQQGKGTVSLSQLVNLYRMNSTREVIETIDYYERLAAKRMEDQQKFMAEFESERAQKEAEFRMMEKKQLSDAEQLSAQIDQMRIEMDRERHARDAEVKLAVSGEQAASKVAVADQDTFVEMEYLKEQKRATDIDTQLKMLELAVSGKEGSPRNVSSPRRKNNIKDD